MAAETSDITESNQDILTVVLAEITALHAEIHEAVRLLRKHDALLEQFRPLIESYRTPAAAFLAARGARRRAVPQDSNGQVQNPVRPDIHG